MNDRNWAINNKDRCNCLSWTTEALALVLTLILSWWTDGMIVEKQSAQNCSWSVNSVIKLSVCYFTDGSLVTRWRTGKLHSSENKQQQNAPPARHCFYTFPQWHKAIWMYSQTFCPLRWSTLNTMLWAILKINIQAATEILMLIWQSS